MSTKKRNLYNMAWQLLCDLCLEHSRAVTAGEFAAFAGIARSTAIRWLEDMLEYGAIQTVEGWGKNGLPKTSYEPVEMSDYVRHMAKMEAREE